MAQAPGKEFGLAGIFDNVRDGLILVRFPQQDIVLFNRAASEMCGVPIDQALDMRMDQIFTDPKVHETARRSSQQPVGLWPGHSQDHLQTRLSGRQGSDGRVELHFCRVEDVGRGGPLVLLVMRPSLELELETAAAQGRAAQRRVDELQTEAREHNLFFNEAAHELKTPLTVVAMQAELLALGSMDAGQERALAIINANIHRLVLLSQDLVDLARVEAGRLVTQTVPVDLVALARREMAGFEPLAARQGLWLGLETQAPAVVVKGDPYRLGQVIGNFLSNAIKFTPWGGRIGLAIGMDRQGMASFRVRDSGPGMKPEDQERLFQPFVRIQAAGWPKKPGTGLGLHLSKRIVEAHGGKVGCSSAGPGQGMVFWFQVPLLNDGSAPAPGHRPRRPSGAQGRKGGHAAERASPAPAGATGGRPRTKPRPQRAA